MNFADSPFSSLAAWTRQEQKVPTRNYCGCLIGQAPSQYGRRGGGGGHGRLGGVFRLAETLSKRHAIAGRHRSLDVLHVATALHLGARDFLTFDANQRKLAAAEKMKVRP